MSSKKTVLKETPNVPVSSQQKVKRKNDYLRECINTILKRELLHLNLKKVSDILANDLHINTRNISPRMKYVLSECLCYYIKMWPGWKQYEVVCTNERAKAEYIEKFKQYLVFKINFILENERIFIQEDSNKKSSRMVSQEVQTDPISKKNKPDAPYNLVISGQPNVLNNIVFIEMDGDIVIKQHAEKPWKPLTVTEFLNYSFVFVSIKLPDLELSRSNLHEFQRYITECGDSATSPTVDFITYIRKRNLSSKPQVYSIDYLHAYCKQFVDVMKNAPGINKVKITELEVLFRQFLLDIKESNVFSCTNSAGKEVNTMATDTSVCFNIGKKTYIRNKKMVVHNDNQKESNAINFCEILIPRMAYTLAKFCAEEDTTTEDTSFKSLNQISEQINKKSPELYKFIEAVNNSVTYQCLLCPKVYTGERAYIDILDHYRFLHKGEQSVLCFSCRKQFTISKLAGSRWSHECTEDNVATTAGTSNNNEQPSTVTTSSTIGISDILLSGRSSISVDDLLKKQGGAVVNGPQNNRILATKTTNNAVITTLPVVRVATSSTIMPTAGVLLAVAPTSSIKPLVTNTIAIASNPVPTPTIPVSIPSSSTLVTEANNVLNSVASTPSSETNGNIFDINQINDVIKSEIDEEYMTTESNNDEITLSNPLNNSSESFSSVLPADIVTDSITQPAATVPVAPSIESVDTVSDLPVSSVTPTPVITEVLNSDSINTASTTDSEPSSDPPTLTNTELLEADI